MNDEKMFELLQGAIATMNQRLLWILMLLATALGAQGVEFALP